jgi:vacuolar protein sorting-associated protein 13A/C
MKEYKELYKQKLLGKKADVENLEKQLNLFSIVLARSQAELETQQILKNKKNEPKRGWFWWGSKKETKTQGFIYFITFSTYSFELFLIFQTSENIINDFKKEITPSEKLRLYEAIGYEEDISHELPPDFIAHKLRFTINKLFITINDENNKISELSLSLSSVELNGSHRPSSEGVVIDTCVKSLYISGIGGIPLLEELTHMDVLSLKLDMNPLDGQYDYGLKFYNFNAFLDLNLNLFQVLI